jgi:hypothetical protein
MGEASAVRVFEATPAVEPTVRPLAIADIRRDGGTQCRVSLDDTTILKYQEQMASGTQFPPIQVWFDGVSYWVSDGFQRIAATERAGIKQIVAEIRSGSREDAQWDSYSCNATHGLPRTTADVKIAVTRAPTHPNCAKLSNAQIAKHLGIPEPTFRRWRKSLSSSSDEDSVRIANRKGTLYPMRIWAIGHGGARSPRSRPKSLRELQDALTEMKGKASPDARNLLNVFSNWAFGSVSDSDCLRTLEGISQRWKRATYS